MEDTPYRLEKLITSYRYSPLCSVDSNQMAHFYKIVTIPHFCYKGWNQASSLITLKGLDLGLKPDCLTNLFC